MTEVNEEMIQSRLEGFSESIASALKEKTDILTQADVMFRIKKWEEEEILNFDAESWINSGLNLIIGYSESLEKTRSDIESVSREMNKLMSNSTTKQVFDTIKNSYQCTSKMFMYYEFLLNSFFDYTLRLMVVSRIQTIEAVRLRELLLRARNVRIENLELKEKYHELSLKDKRNEVMLERATETEKKLSDAEKKIVELQELILSQRRKQVLSQKSNGFHKETEINEVEEEEWGFEPEINEAPVKKPDKKKQTDRIPTDAEVDLCRTLLAEHLEQNGKIHFKKEELNRILNDTKIETKKHFAICRKIAKEEWIDGERTGFWVIKSD